jgi:hypothetical protein
MKNFGESGEANDWSALEFPVPEKPLQRAPIHCSWEQGMAYSLANLEAARSLPGFEEKRLARKIRVPFEL